MIPKEKFLAWKMKKFPEEFPIKQLIEKNPGLFKTMAASDAKKSMEEAHKADKKERESISKELKEKGLKGMLKEIDEKYAPNIEKAKKAQKRGIVNILEMGRDGMKEELIEITKDIKNYRPYLSKAFGNMKSRPTNKSVFRLYQRHIGKGYSQYAAALMALRETGVKIVVIKKKKSRKYVPIEKLTPLKLKALIEPKKKS